jgi:hypothetical protein
MVILFANRASVSTIANITVIIVASELALFTTVDNMVVTCALCAIIGKIAFLTVWNSTHKLARTVVIQTIFTEALGTVISRRTNITTWDKALKLAGGVVH